MDYTLTDLEAARQRVVDSDSEVGKMLALIRELEEQGKDALGARVLLADLETAWRGCVEKLGEIRAAIDMQRSCFKPGESGYPLRGSTLRSD